MNKKVKRNSKDYKARRFFKCSVVLLVMMTTLSIASSLFIKNINNSLTMQIEDLNKEAEVLKTQNDQLNIEISNLASKERVYEIDTAAGLKHNQTDLSSVVRGE